jgi:hypothetical protein
MFEASGSVGNSTQGRGLLEEKVEGFGKLRCRSNISTLTLYFYTSGIIGITRSGLRLCVTSPYA